ncbi:hypothetical protein DFA_00646 [Cavenderia fasciculata]|uniref:Uncharacterized protein n=1 Tax=Cavenderia fasciculata TaxID=261658 RepID=F4PSZ2_CACFS|nr:uncharacterized protein DFA_00646 [Cavenderia fasciculata]EGG20781.1 hypothetical protein DFA_00646 [Cavenderia fasciculata]|eukprot:XP_004358631.1 hypothetical protein DFA_00646 [Cavenderia fasciculata]
MDTSRYDVLELLIQSKVPYTNEFSWYLFNSGTPTVVQWMLAHKDLEEKDLLRHSSITSKVEAIQAKVANFLTRHPMQANNAALIDRAIVNWGVDSIAAELDDPHADIHQILDFIHSSFYRYFRKSIQRYIYKHALVQHIPAILERYSGSNAYKYAMHCALNRPGREAYEVVKLMLDKGFKFLPCPLLKVQVVSEECYALLIDKVSPEHRHRLANRPIINKSVKQLWEFLQLIARTSSIDLYKEYCQSSKLRTRVQNFCMEYGNLEFLKLIHSISKPSLNLDSAIKAGRINIVEYMLETFPNETTLEKWLSFIVVNGPPHLLDHFLQKDASLLQQVQLQSQRPGFSRPIFISNNYQMFQYLVSSQVGYELNRDGERILQTLGLDVENVFLDLYNSCIEKKYNY